MATLKYSLSQFHRVAKEGFDFVVPEDTIDLISSLATEVGSATYIRAPVFQKKEYEEEPEEPPVYSPSSAPPLSKKKKNFSKLILWKEQVLKCKQNLLKRKVLMYLLFWFKTKQLYSLELLKEGQGKHFLVVVVPVLHFFHLSKMAYVKGK